MDTPEKRKGPGTAAGDGGQRRKGREILLAGDRQTLNVLMLELATMVVAIALAFSASFLTVFRLDIVLVFVFTTAIVIWFWWDYIRDRLLYPPVTNNFPYLDVLVLILISLLPFALRQGSVTYISSVLSVLLLVWALMISRIMSERREVIDERTQDQLRREVVQRALIGMLLLANSVLSVFTSFGGTVALSVILTAVIAWNITGRVGGHVPMKDGSSLDRA